MSDAPQNSPDEFRRYFAAMRSFVNGFGEKPEVPAPLMQAFNDLEEDLSGEQFSRLLDELPIGPATAQHNIQNVVRLADFRPKN